MKVADPEGHMSISGVRQRLDAILESLPETKLEAVLDFVSQLKDTGIEGTEDFLEMQMNSHAYGDWLGSESDIYDEVFKNELEKG